MVSEVELGCLHSDMSIFVPLGLNYMQYKLFLLPRVYLFALLLDESGCWKMLDVDVERGIKFFSKRKWGSVISENNVFVRQLMCDGYVLLHM